MHEIIRDYRAGRLTKTEAAKRFDDLMLAGKLTARSAAAYKANLDDVRSAIKRPQRETEAVIRLATSAMDELESHGRNERDDAVVHVFRLYYLSSSGRHHRMEVAFHHQASTGKALGCEVRHATLDEGGGVLEERARPRKLALIENQNGLAASSPSPLRLPKLGSYRFILDQALNEHMKATAQAKANDYRWVFRLQEVAWRKLISTKLFNSESGAPSRA